MTKSTGHDPQVDEAVVTRSEERVELSTELFVGSRVRVSKRVVSEERVVTVTVRREELVVEHLDGGPGHDRPRDAATDGTADVTTRAQAEAPVLELVLSEDEVEVTSRVVPRERVRVYVDRVTELVDIEESVRREVVEVEHDG